MTGHLGHRRAAVGIVAALVVGCLAAIGPRAAACPFCTALGPSVTQRREAADVVLVAEVLAGAPGEPTRFRVHQRLTDSSGRADHDELAAKVDVALRRGDLALLFGQADDDSNAEIAWSALPVNETSLGYALRAPSLRQPAAERLRYFLKYLEHRDPLMAEDAYLEFGHAPFDDVAALASELPFERIRRWLVDPAVPPARKGLYGLLAGLARDEPMRAANAAFLRTQIEQPAVDFRAGFDGVLGGYLLAADEPGLDWLDQRYLRDRAAAVGDVRHLHTALRFYREFGRGIERARLTQSMRRLLDRPDVAAAAIVDLARWQDWEVVDRVAALYARPGYGDAPTRRAIVSYLAACPRPEAASQLARLREQDPQGVAAAEQELAALGGRGA